MSQPGVHAYQTLFANLQEPPDSLSERACCARDTSAVVVPPCRLRAVPFPHPQTLENHMAKHRQVFILRQKNPSKIAGGAPEPEGCYYLSPRPADILSWSLAPDCPSRPVFSPPLPSETLLGRSRPGRNFHFSPAPVFLLVIDVLPICPSPPRQPSSPLPDPNYRHELATSL
jgi:hypothetical protein